MKTVWRVGSSKPVKSLVDYHDNCVAHFEPSVALDALAPKLVNNLLLILSFVFDALVASPCLSV
ncbi:hypothetical protein BZM27_53975 [Paraburkholderia steynii]|uniref:Uncharacterized protein n=1 Tax=Paraburkholderia steynii TaxID=1245441 RepID=A0A4R0X5N3_9BURK|nr:hypothetical protein BZM27_53975 [Paraburkholderia steynii]